jgi:phosphoserine phosphatase RsbU/P
LHATFHSLARTTLPLEGMVEAANRIFSESTLAGQFATMVVGHASHDGSVDFVSAGHLPVLHLGSHGVKSEGATGVPLGMFGNTRFPVRKMILGSGDTLLLYTDGLTEARNAASEEYGVLRIQENARRRYGAAPDALIAGCLCDLRGFTAGAKFADDVTLLALNRTA